MKDRRTWISGSQVFFIPIGAHFTHSTFHFAQINIFFWHVTRNLIYVFCLFFFSVFSFFSRKPRPTALFGEWYYRDMTPWGCYKTPLGVPTHLLTTHRPARPPGEARDLEENPQNPGKSPRATSAGEAAERELRVIKFLSCQSEHTLPIQLSILRK